MFYDGSYLSRDCLRAGKLAEFFNSTWLFGGLVSEPVLVLELAALFTLGILDIKVCLVSEKTACWRGFGKIGGGICGGNR